MSNEQALLDCPFGWGRTCHLSANSLEIGGKTYQLEELTAIRPTYRTILGVSSARIELYFGLRRLVLRGIPDQETARLLVARLQPHCTAVPGALRMHLRAGRARSVAREQARLWERSAKLPASPPVPPVEQASAHHPAVPRAPSRETIAPAVLSAGHVYANPFESLPDPLLVARDDGWSLARTRPLRTPRFQPPLHSVHLVPPDQKGQDTCSLPVPAIRASVLPVIEVSVRLQPGECAHYSIGASLCSDRISGSDRAPYPLLDRGLLILTNRRLFYLSKRSQLILAYTHLWYVSLLHNAIALHLEQQFRRIIIELEHPQEWASRIEHLAFLARRSRSRSDLPTLLLAAVPDSSSSVSDAITQKRPTLKAQGSASDEQSRAWNRSLPGEPVISPAAQASTPDLSHSGELVGEYAPLGDPDDTIPRVRRTLAPARERARSRRSGGEVSTGLGDGQEQAGGVPARTTENLASGQVRTIVLRNRQPSDRRGEGVSGAPGLPDIEVTPRLVRTGEPARPSRQAQRQAE